VEMKSNVTLVIPAYEPNREWFDMCLKSIPDGFAETILCDDGSYPPIPEATIRHPKNEGLAATKNSGVAAVQTKWVAVLDCDDWFDAEGVAALLSVIDDIDADIVHFPIRVFPSQWVWKADDARFETMIQDNSIAGVSWFTKAAWQRNGGYQYRLCEDWDFWLRAIKNGMRFHYFPKVVYNYRSNSHGLCEKVVIPNMYEIRKHMREQYAG
jgi:glycosyltransferase involved in cell wall biosynthesis